MADLNDAVLQQLRELGRQVQEVNDRTAKTAQQVEDLKEAVDRRLDEFERHMQERVELIKQWFDRELRDLERDAGQLETRVFGGLQPGVLGEQKTKLAGLADRIRKMENSRAWRLGWIAGFSAAISLVTMAVVFALKRTFGWH